VFICDRFSRSQNNRFAFGKDSNPVTNSMRARCREQAGRRFIQRFVAETKTSVMHRHERIRAQLEESLHRFLRIHVHFAPGGRVIGSDREQRDVDIVSLADFLEPFEIGAVATMKNGAAIRLDNESAESAMEIGQETGAPMRTGCKRDLERAELHGLPIIELVNDVESKIVNEIADSDRNNDRLIGRDLRQGAAIEMIEMGVRDENEINRREMMNLEPRLLQPLDYF